jgi:triphosphoribosyl-dephospho-CoA synthase
MYAPLTLGEAVRLACRWEARARKAGNVTPEHGFADLTVDDFYRSADAIAPVFEGAGARAVGVTVLQAIEATLGVAASNTNLGIVLLLAPLAKVPPQLALRAGIETVLNGLTVEDTRAAYAAIRLARAGGLGTAPEQDLRQEPTVPLRQAMALAQERDLIARQYANGFHEVLGEGLAALAAALERFGFVEDAIIFCQLTLLAGHPDSLIARKLGPAAAQEATRRARQTLDAGWPKALEAKRRFAELDGWLRAAGNARNPGTTADLVTACLFAALRERIMNLTPSTPWSPIVPSER